MRFPHPGQRFVAPWRAPPTAPVAQFACGSRAQGSASWPHRGAPPKARPSGAVRMRFPHPKAALRGPIGSPNESGTHNALRTMGYGW
eukprot:7459197-Pyramimonas_sp.AAC.1